MTDTVGAARERILVVDDSEMNRSILADMLSEKFDVTEAEDGEVALEILSKQAHAFSLVLLDIVMPVKDGFDVLTEMNRTGLIENLPVIMISAETASAQIERAYELGATDFITRPFDASIVYRRVLNTIFLYAKQRKLMGVIEQQIDEKEQNSSMMVDILSHIVEFRNGESGLHILHVRTITDFLLHKLVKKTTRYTLTDADISVISMASALHDIGKIGIDDKILNKPGKLTAEEFAVMKSHSVIGANMLQSLTAYKDNPLVRHAYEICRWHHERWDGKGYPDGLKGDDIPISAQIVALADVYDALTSERVYKPALTGEQAKQMILRGECGAFNPLLLECFADEFDSICAMFTGCITDNVARREVRNLADAALHSNGIAASDRTLKLLDYERMKYSFYEQLTDEIQFEYNAETNILRLSPFGANKLGVDTEIVNPAANRLLKDQLGGEWFGNLGKVLQQTTPSDPEFKCECQLAINGEMRWYSVIMRVIWTDEVQPAISSVIGKIADVNTTHVAISELKEKSMRDPLTGLLNRAGAKEELQHKFDSFPDRKFAVAVFDIDRFKSANDKYGHQFGDKVLKELAERLLHSTRVHDLCARVGGDEFVIVFDYDADYDIHAIVARVFKSLCGKVDDFDLTVSMGIAEMTCKSQSFASLFKQADIALYVTKNGGKNAYAFYDKSMGDAVAH